MTERTKEQIKSQAQNFALKLIAGYLSSMHHIDRACPEVADEVFELRQQLEKLDLKVRLNFERRAIIDHANNHKVA